jgi:hypothetical protein
MPAKKRAKKQPEPAKQIFDAARSKRKRRPGEPRKKAEPVPVIVEVKSVMHRILESQREQLNQLSDDLQQVIFFGW